MVDVSVIIPIFNVAPYIEECIESVLTQQHSAALECILIDDASTDGSMLLAKKRIEHSDTNIEFKFFSHTFNRGLSAARNTGLDNATGRYIFFLDSDDCISPAAMAAFADFESRHPCVDVVAGNVNPDPQYAWIRHNFTTDTILNNGTDIRRALLLGELPPTAWNKWIRRDIITRSGLRFAEGWKSEDEIWTFFLQRHIASLGIMPQPTYTYRYRNNGIIGSMTDIEKASLLLNLTDYLITNASPLQSKEERSKILTMLFNHQLHFGASINASGRRRADELMSKISGPDAESILTRCCVAMLRHRLGFAARPLIRMLRHRRF